MQQKNVEEKKSYCKSTLQYSVYRKFKNMQNNYIILWKQIYSS